jgi:hypothetical protein
MHQIVRRLPVIEGLIAVLYWRIDRSQYVGSEEDIESANWLDSERSRWSVGTIISMVESMQSGSNYLFFGLRAGCKGPRAVGGLAPGEAIIEYRIAQ